MTVPEPSVGPGLEAELHPSARWVSLLLVGTGLLVFLTGDFWCTPEQRLALLAFSSLALLLAGGLWLLAAWMPKAAQWAAAVVLAGVVYLGAVWFEPALLSLLVVPVVLATSLVGLSAALVVTAGETVLLFASWQARATGIDSASIVAVLTLWCTCAAVAIVYRPVRQVTEWYWAQYQRIDELLKQARDQRAELVQRMEDLQHATRQLVLLNERIAVMRQVAEEAQKAKAAFVARVSHEFRTPLNMIIGLVDLVMETPQIYGAELPPELVQDLRIVHRNCNHLVSMINDVLDLSRIEAARLSLYREWVSLGQEIADALAVAQPLMEKKGLQWSTQVADDVPKVYCDRTRIRQVIVNLVSNAVRFTDEGAITVRVAVEGEEVTVSVGDTGRGMPAEDVEKVFEPFFQPQPHSQRAFGGAGLGLAICRSLVEMHGGRIWATSEPGRGSTFTFSLPVPRSEGSTPRAVHGIRQGGRWLGRQVAPGLLEEAARQRLIVYDESAGVLGPLVRDLHECEFVYARELAEVYAQLEDCPAHAVLLNASSPADSLALAQRAQASIRDTPIIACSIPQPMKLWQDLGVSEWLVKPVIAADLRNAIESLHRPITRLLLVDDDPEVQQLIERMLGAYDRSLEIVAASTGERALEILRDQHIDVLLLDYMLPGMRGDEVLERKSRDQALRDVPVVVISAQEPESTPPRSPFLLATIGGGVSIGQIVKSSLELSALLLGADSMPDPGRRQTAAA